MSKISIIIPCYNESLRLNQKAFSDFISENQSEYDIIFVNDGSTDNTLDILNKISIEFPNNFFICNLSHNCGKAEAVRVGINFSYEKNQYNYMAYFDADLATPLSEINFLKKIAVNNPLLVMVLCSRIKRLGANINRNSKRHILGRIFSTFASKILKLPVYDTQCGAKLIKAEIIPYVFNKPFVTSWIFDVEILARIRNNNRDTITSILYEHPVSKWEDVGGSKLKFKHMVKVPLELFKIKQFYNK